jgi:hypothetical protein
MWQLRALEIEFGYNHSRLSGNKPLVPLLVPVVSVTIFPRLRLHKITSAS